MTDKPKEGGAATQPPIVENLHAPEVYADTAPFFAHKNGNVSITFASLRFDNTASPGVAKNVVVGRVVMPATYAHALAAGLFDYMKKNGLSPDTAATAN